MPAVFRGMACEGTEHVKLGGRFGSSEKLRRMFGGFSDELVVELFFERGGALFGGERSVFNGFEFGRDESFAVFQGLPALIVHRHLIGRALCHFNIKAAHLVVLHPQRIDARGRALTLFHFEQNPAGVVTKVPKFGEFRTAARGDRVAVAEHAGGLRDKGLLQALPNLRVERHAPADAGNKVKRRVSERSAKR